MRAHVQSGVFGENKRLTLQAFRAMVHHCPTPREDLLLGCAESSCVSTGVPSRMS